MLCAGCAVTGDPVAVHESVPPSSQTPAIRQTDDAGRRLPFETKWPDRWSINNDGTSYEPCTGVGERVLRQLNLDPDTASDAAVANGQTARGCEWSYASDKTNKLSQVVGNGPPLAEYRAMNKNDFDFLPDTVVQGRPVLRFVIIGPNECTAAVQSGTAQVITTVYIYNETPPIDQLCKIPVDFLRATIDKIPR